VSPPHAPAAQTGRPLRAALLRGAAAVALALSLAWCLASLASSGRPGARVRLELWTLALRPHFDAYMAERLGAFERAHAGVAVDWVDLPFDALDRKLIAAAAAGRAPDVVNLSDLQFGRFVGLGALADLRPHLPPGTEDLYLPGAVRLGRIDGRLMALPWYLTTQVSMINTDLLAAGGLAPEDLAHRWEDLRGQAVEYHRRTGKYKYLFSQPMGSESQIPVMMLASGISPFRDGGDGRLRADLTRPEVVAYVRGWVDFYRSGAMPRAAATRNHAHLTEMYKNAGLAMIDTGPNFLSRVKNDSAEVFRKTTVRAGVTGRLDRQHLAVMTLCVTSSSPHKPEAAALAAFLTGTESQLGLCAKAPVLPSTVEGARSPVVRGDPPPPGADPAEVRARALAADSLDTAVAFTPALIAWPDLRRAFEDGIKAALLDGRPVETVLAEVNARWDRMLEAAGPAPVDAVPAVGPAPASPPTADRGQARREGPR
jgi:putative chitobiose transport system substrate-binding protein